MTSSRQLRCRDKQEGYPPAKKVPPRPGLERRALRRDLRQLLDVLRRALRRPIQWLYRERLCSLLGDQIAGLEHEFHSVTRRVHKVLNDQAAMARRLGCLGKAWQDGYCLLPEKAVQFSSCNRSIRYVESGLSQVEHDLSELSSSVSEADRRCRCLQRRAGILPGSERPTVFNTAPAGTPDGRIVPRRFDAGTAAKWLLTAARDVVDLADKVSAIEERHYCLQAFLMEVFSPKRVN